MTPQDLSEPTAARDETWYNSGSRITGSPAVSGGQLYVGTADGRLVAYART